jgi:hypothetical protein
MLHGCSQCSTKYIQEYMLLTYLTMCRTPLTSYKCIVCCGTVTASGLLTGLDGCQFLGGFHVSAVRHLRRRFETLFMIEWKRLSCGYFSFLSEWLYSMDYVAWMVMLNHVGLPWGFSCIVAGVWAEYEDVRGWGCIDYLVPKWVPSTQHGWSTDNGQGRVSKLK